MLSFLDTLMLKLILILLFSLLLFGCSDETPNTSDISPSSKTAALLSTSHYVGSQKCVSCHEQEYKAWQNSHHDLSMQPATNETVMGDFNNTSFNYFGTVSKFYKKDNQFYVQTDGPDGKLTEFPIAYTFGTYPLQQYLIKFPKGRNQALNIVWDTRSKQQDGQRWFHLYPDEHIKHNDELHWTGINQNWNFMCADCHSTNLAKNYDFKTDTYNTNWSEIDVACEACHGPASKHVSWTDKKSTSIHNKGFSVAFKERQNISWVIDEVTGNAKRSKNKNSNHEINMCAQCHSRRLTAKPGARPDSQFLDHFQPAFLTESLYHADGQINGEVYVYGSFLQSKMYHTGVSCSDCHEPHSLKLRAEGNTLCAQCHLPAKYDSTEHHLHNNESSGSQCVNCHMPSKTYMVVDPRRDHSFRVPRPDLSEKIGTPNACNQCHKERTLQWAATVLEQKFGNPNKRHYAEALHAGRQGLASAEKLLSDLIVDGSQPAIARATAVSLLPRYLTQRSVPVLQMAANDEEPLLGYGLAMVLDSIPQQHRLPFAYPLLYDDNRITRSLAGRALFGVSMQNLPAEATTKLNHAIEEYISAQMFIADRPESLVNLAGLYAQQGQTQQAEQFYQSAIKLAPYYTPAYANLADFYRIQGDETKSEAVLRKALLQVGDKTAIQHALGLLLIRQQKLNEAIHYLNLSAKSATTNTRYVYVYAIALHSSGKVKLAIVTLEQAHNIYPTNIDIIYALISIYREVGNQEKANDYETRLQVLNQ